jgi:hypothetical protein
MEDYDQDVPFDFHSWQEQMRLSDSFDDYTSVASSLTVSRSPSLPSKAVDSPLRGTTSTNTRSQPYAEIKLTWPDDGERQLRKDVPKKAINSKLRFRSASIQSVISIEDAMPADSHHEGSCQKCRMTEAEARKCRLERRREQNRASQRKFRARKEAKIKEAAGQVATLETYVEFLEKHNGDLEATNANLRQKITDMEKIRLTSLKHVARDAFMSILKGTDPVKTSTTNAVSTARREAMDLYLPLFDHELEPLQHQRNKV